MDDQATPTPDDDIRVPDPHRDEPVPEPQEGQRPATERAIRPEQDEEVGPLEGLMSASAAKVDAEAAEVTGDRDPEAEALLASMGVEEEGIEGGQLLGLVAAVLAAVAALAVILIYLFYIPYRDQTEVRADGMAQYPELEVVETEGIAKLSQYRRTDEAYGLPIGRAMGAVVAQYGSSDAVGLPETAQEWNTFPVMRGMGAAVDSLARGRLARQPDSTQVRGALAGPEEEVGVDAEAAETVTVIDNDTDPIE